MPARRDILLSQTQIENWISEGKLKAFICRELSCKPSTLDSYLQIMGIEYRGNMGAKGQKASPFRTPASDYLFVGSMISPHRLKLKLIADGLKAWRCEGCLGEQWQSQAIPTELHHKNGNRNDNRLENLEILCPNCHALTENHAGKSSHRTVESRTINGEVV